MKKDYLINQLRALDDTDFIDVIDELTELSVNVDFKPNDDIIHLTQLQDEVTEIYQNWGKVTGLLTGFKSIDNKIGGLGKGHVILIGGETSNGKSALATNIAVNVAKHHGVLYITLEMLQNELGARIMHVNNGRIDNLDIMFQSDYRIDYKDIDPTIKKAKEVGKIELVVLDYMQYLGRGMKLEEVAKMSKEFKSLALKYQIPFIIIVSLRKAEQGKGKRKWFDIEIEEFMGTGSIGYDCDTAMIASRKNEENEFDETGIWIKILKTRNTKLDYNNRIFRLDWDKTKISETDWIPTI